MGLINKIFFGYLALEFANGFNEVKRSKKEKALEFITREIVSSECYQNLIEQGKTAKEISKILDIKNMNKEKFELITGKVWPLV